MRADIHLLRVRILKRGAWVENMMCRLIGKTPEDVYVTFVRTDWAEVTTIVCLKLYWFWEEMGGTEPGVAFVGA